MLEQRKWDDAVLTLNYAFADNPPSSEMTRAQLELMLEICCRLGTIEIVRKNKKMSEKYMTLAHYYRKDLGWKIEQYNTWEEPIFTDTCARMGIKE